MPDHTFTTGSSPTIHLNGCDGTLHVEAGDSRQIDVNLAGVVDDIRQDNDTIVIDRSHGDMRLRVPVGTIIAVDDLRGDADIRGVAMLTIEGASRNVQVTRISGDVRLRDMRGDVTVDGARALRIEEDTEMTHQWREHQTVTVRNVANVDIQNVYGDLVVDTAETVLLGNIAANAHLKHPGEMLRFENVGGNLDVDGGESTEVSGENVGGNARLDALRRLTLENVGGEAVIRSVRDETRLNTIGGTCRITAGGRVFLGTVGGTLHLDGSGPVQLNGPIGGSLTLQQTMLEPADGGQLMVGGSARIELPLNPNLTLHVTAGGAVRGAGVHAQGGPSMVTLVYGDGATQLHLTIGGSLDLVGGGTPRVLSSTWATWSDTDASVTGEASTDAFTSAWETFGKDFGASFAFAFASGQERQEPPAVVPPSEREQERLAVLRMIANGRISPAEGELLLNALG